MGKKRHSLGSKVRPKKNKKKKKSKKWKKDFIEPDKLELGIEELCKQLPEVCLDPGSSSSISNATQKFLETCNISESATDPVFDRKKKKKDRSRRRRLKLMKKNSEGLKQLFSTVAYDEQLPKKEEKNLCQLLDNLSCKPVSMKPTEPPKLTESPKPGFIFTEQDAKSFHKKLKNPRRRNSSDSD